MKSARQWQSFPSTSAALRYTRPLHVFHFACSPTLNTNSSIRNSAMLSNSRSPVSLHWVHQKFSCSWCSIFVQYSLFALSRDLAFMLYRKHILWANSCRASLHVLHQNMFVWEIFQGCFGTNNCGCTCDTRTGRKLCGPSGRLLLRNLWCHLLRKIKERRKKPKDLQPCRQVQTKNEANKNNQCALLQKPEAANKFVILSALPLEKGHANEATVPNPIIFFIASLEHARGHQQRNKMAAKIEKVDMSLDDIIKQNKKNTRGGRGGRGRRGRGGGGPVRGGRGRINKNRSTPYSRVSVKNFCRTRHHFEPFACHDLLWCRVC